MRICNSRSDISPQGPELYPEPLDLTVTIIQITKQNDSPFTDVYDHIVAIEQKGLKDFSSQRSKRREQAGKGT